MKLEIVGGVGVPRTIAKKAGECVRSRRRRRKDSFERNDQVWAVFDRDEHPHFKGAVTDCENLGINVARSNPCFELWLILHQKDHDQLCTRRQVQETLKNLHPEYDKRGAKTPDCDALILQIEEAERRAEAQLRRRKQEGQPCGNPSTTVGRLTRAIGEADKRSRP